MAQHTHGKNIQFQCMKRREKMKEREILKEQI